MNILADRSLTYVSEAFPPPFTITYYEHGSDIQCLLAQPVDVLICRSTLKVDSRLLQQAKLGIVATASSGRDHIDESYLNQRAIMCFDAKGSNAHAVADYVLSMLALIDRKQPLIKKKIGIVGLGAVGSLIFKRLDALGLSLVCFDPLKAQVNQHFTSATLNDIIDCDVICIHANLHRQQPYASHHLFNLALLSQLKSNTWIINAARGGVVCEQALLSLNHPIHYCCDVFEQEPNINPEIVNYAEFCTPHIAGHSIEAKDRAIALLSEKIHRYYRLPTPCFAHLSIAPLLLTDNNQDWQNKALHAYDPRIETTLLKQAVDKTATFAVLRHAHCQRHDFNW